MTTQAEVLKIILDAGDYTGYRKDVKPDIGIRNLEDIQAKQVDKSMILVNKNASPMWAFNGVKLVGDHFVDLLIGESKSDERDNLIDRLDVIFQASSRDITYTIPEHPDKYPKFFTVLRIKMLI